MADSGIVEALERMHEEFSHAKDQISPLEEDEEALKSELELDGSVTVNATVLQPTDNHPNKRLTFLLPANHSLHPLFWRSVLLFLTSF